MVPSATISVANASLNEIGNVSAFVAPGSGGLNQPKDLVMGPDGNVYVASGTTNSVISYTATGQLLGSFVPAGSGGLSNPKGLAFGPDGNLYVDSVANNNVLEYSGSTGAFLSTFVSPGSGGLSNPCGMMFGPDGNLYVSSVGTQSVDRFQGPLGIAPGSPLPAAGQSGATFVAPGSGGLAGPGELTFGPNGNLFVANGLPVSGVTNNNYGVLEFDATTGNFITTYVGSNYVNSPRGIAFDQEGRLYVADMSTNAIHRFDSQGNYLDDPVTGSASSLQVPLGITFDGQGGLLVSSRDGNAVYRYDRGVTVTLSAASATPVSVAYTTADGTATAPVDYTAQSGTVTFAPGQTSQLVLLVTHYDSAADGNETLSVQLSNPTGATIATGTATVTVVEPSWPQLSIANASAIEGDTTAHYRGAFVQSPGNTFNPVTIGPDGNVYTAVGTGPGYNTIERYNGATGAFMGTFASGPINGVRTIVFRGGSMYVASEYTNQVLQYNASTGAYVGVFVAAGSGGISGPTGMAFDSAGNLYVSGRNSNNVVKYDTNGNPVATYIAAGSGGLNLPEGIAFDPSGIYLYVASSGTNQVLKYNAGTGAYVGVGASSGLASPHNTTFGADGLMYVSSGGNNRILRFTENGTYVDDYVPAGSGGLSDPHWMAFGPNGDLYVGGTGTDDQIHQFGTENEALFNVSLSTAFPAPVTVSYAAADGTAIAGTNYTATSGTLTFAPGVTTQTIRVPILNDGVTDTSLTFTVNLSNPVAATLSGGQAVGTILETDGPVQAPSGIVSWWTGEGNGTDSIGANAGSLNSGVTFAPGKVGSAFNFNGTSYVSANTSGLPTGNSDRTMEMWVKVNAFNANETFFAGYGGFGSTNQTYQLGAFNDGRLFFSQWGQSIAGPAMQAGVWNHIAVSNVGSSVTLYLNGAAVASGTFTITTPTNSTFYMGRIPGSLGDTRQLNGLVDEAAVYNRALTPIEIQSIYAAGSFGKNRSNGTKFYIVDDGSTDRTYDYGITGNSIGSYTINSGNSAPRGDVSTAAGTTVWVVDANKKVYVYNASGVLQGSWSAGSLSSSTQLTGIATNGTDVWLVDRYSAKVYKYAGAATRLSGSQSAASSFKLASGNANPQDLVTDGTSIWVVDGTTHKVFKYTVAGSSLGNWSIDPANAHPTGITINPNNVSDIWIVDNGTDLVYQYIGAATRTSGSQSAAATFALAAGNSNPQGIADPPPPGDAVVASAPMINSGTNPQGIADPPLTVKAVLAPMPTTASAPTQADSAASQVPFADLWGTPLCQTATQVDGSQCAPAADLFANARRLAGEAHGAASLSATTTLARSPIDQAFAGDLDSWPVRQWWRGAQ